MKFWDFEQWGINSCGALGRHLNDSFFFRISTFLSNYVPLYVRLIILGLTFAAAMYLLRSGHVVISHEKRPDSVVASGAFGHVRHPLYLASILGYLGLTVSTVSLFSKWVPKIGKREG